MLYTSETAWGKQAIQYQVPEVMQLFDRYLTRPSFIGQFRQILSSFWPHLLGTRCEGECYPMDRAFLSGVCFSSNFRGKDYEKTLSGDADIK